MSPEEYEKKYQEAQDAVSAGKIGVARAILRDLAPDYPPAKELLSKIGGMPTPNTPPADAATTTYFEALRLLASGDYNGAQKILSYHAHVHEPSNYLLRAVRRKQQIVLNPNATEMVEQAYETGRQALIAGNRQLAEEMLLRIAHFHEPARALLSTSPTTKSPKTQTSTPTGLIIAILLVCIVSGILLVNRRDGTATTSAPRSSSGSPSDERALQLVLDTPGIKLRERDIDFLYANTETKVISLRYALRPAALSVSEYLSQVENDFPRIVCKLRQNGFSAYEYWIDATAKGTDANGNDVIVKAVDMKLTSAESIRLNCSNLNAIDLSTVATRYVVHPDLQE